MKILNIFKKLRQQEKEIADLKERLSKSIYHPHCTALQAGYDGRWRCMTCGKDYGSSRVR